MAAVGGGQHVARSATTVGTYLDEWLVGQEARLRPTSWNSYRVAIKRIKAGIGSVSLQALTPLAVEQLYADLLRDGAGGTRGLSAKTVRNTHIVLRKALADAERLGLVVRNAAAAARPPVPTKRDQTTWNPEQLAQFLESVGDERLAAAFVLLATTGMRRGEALGVRWTDIDLSGGRLAIVQTVTTVNDKVVISPPKTARSRRSISLDAATIAALREHRRRQAEERLKAGTMWAEGSDLAFTDELGRPVHPSAFSRLFVTCARREGLPAIRLHDLRHTYATVALGAGVHPKIVSERLGHATTGVTMDLYSHVAPSLDAEAASLIADRIFARDLPSNDAK
jgi:integrase